MITSRVFVEGLAWLLTVDGSDTQLCDATLVIEGDRIAAVGRADDIRATDPPGPGDIVVDGRRMGAVPGFIDTHVHLSETLSRAVFVDNLATRAWVFHWAKPFYAHVNREDERVSVLLGAAEMLRCGTTCFLDMGAQSETEVTVRAIEEIGIRGITGHHAADNKPERLPPGWTDEMVDRHFFPNHAVALEYLEQCVRDWNGYADGRIRCWVNIEGKEPCSQELHVGARQLASDLGVGTTYHIASSLQEAQVSERRHGMWPITRIDERDGLGSNLVLAHAVAVSDREVETLARTNTRVAFCPSSSLKLAKGATAIGKYPEMQKAGVIVGLGTDGVAAAGNLNQMRQMYLAAGLFKDARIDENQGGARRALRMATADAAKALNWDDEIGSLEAGKKADFVLFDLDSFEWTPYADPLQALVWSATSASIAQTWVNGKCLFDGTRVSTIDERPLHAEARQRARAIAERAGLTSGEVPVTTSLYD